MAGWWNQVAGYLVDGAEPAVSMETASKQGNLWQLLEKKGETILYLTGFANCNKIEAVTRMDTQFFVGNTTSVFVHLAMMMILMMIVVMIVVMILMMILMMMQKIVDTVWPHMLKWGERHKVTFLH